MQVAIVGAGPVGCLLACELRAKGVGVDIYEAKADVSDDVVCTGIVSGECVDVYDCWDCVVRPIDRINIAMLPSPKTKSLDVNKHKVYLVDRPRLNKRMMEKAVELGTRVHTGCRVVDRPEADIVAYACGHSGRRVLGLNGNKPYRLGLQCEAELSGEVEDVNVYLSPKMFPNGFAWIVRVDERRGLAGVLCDSGEGRSAFIRFADFVVRYNLAANLRNARVKTQPISMSDDLCGDGYIVVGEAAGQVKPTTGGGLYYGGLCVRIASTAIGLVESGGWPTAKAFELYKAKCVELLGGELCAGRFAMRLYNTLSMRALRLLLPIVARGSDNFDFHASSFAGGALCR